MSPDQVERPDEDLLRDATRGDNAAFVAYCDRKLPGARDFFAGPVPELDGGPAR